MLASPAPMHIPDGFLTPLVAVLGWVLALASLSLAVRRTQASLGEKQVPMMGVLAAFIFAAQAFNFPVAAGTSGHLLGGALAAILMGPWAASLMMSAVIILQGLVFQDGGLLVMGWNMVNMGLITAVVGFAVYRAARKVIRDRRVGQLAGAFVAAWLSVEVAAMATAVELALSGTFPLNLALPAMAGVHALVGIGEAIITTGAVLFLQTVRPDLLERSDGESGKLASASMAVGLGIALLVACLSPLASPSPDGLESVAGVGGFLQLEGPALYEILPGYSVPFVMNPALATALAVIVGTLLVFGVGWLVGRLAVRRRHTV
jgi:cobalt/nickel transport system permease protein